MSITANCHLHSSFSGDSHTPMEEMVLAGIACGLRTMCFTEHHDIDLPDSPGAPGSIFLLDAEAYLKEFLRLREKYRGQICLLFGVELGLQPHIAHRNAAFVRAHDLDFIIGSVHVCSGMDPYYPAFYEGRSEEEAYLEYFTAILENVKKFSDFDVCGHLDYVVRYGPNKDRNYSYDTYRDVFDEILKVLLENGRGLELNTGGIRKGMRDFHPCADILKRYRQLGGEIITVGSDSHTADHITDSFSRAADALLACGFRYYTVFRQRRPEFIRL